MGEIDEIIKSKYKKDLTILNIAAGKFKPLFLNNIELKYFLINLDRMFLDSDSIKNVISEQRNFVESKSFRMSKLINLNHEIFSFISNYHLSFNIISIYRFLEHVPKKDILYFIYLLSTCVEVGGYLDIIVPDYEKLAKKILNEDPFSSDFEKDDIETTFEILNEPYDPHASIWTENRIKKFFTLEERFNILKITKDFEFDGRDIYIRFLVERIK